MIIGTGVDIVEISRIERILAKWGRAFLDKVFHPEEIEYSYSQRRPALHLSARFGAKEAYLKAIGTGVGKGMRLLDVTVMRNDNGQPAIRLFGQASVLAAEKGWGKIHLSLSHTHSLAIAQVIVETD